MEAPLPNSALRLIDANLNRASEGLRVLEDFARFILNDVHICSEYKHLRHALAVEMDSLGGSHRYLTRDVGGDVGTEVTTATESVRPDLISVAKAAAARSEQSLRCLEECSKLASARVAQNLEQIRYRAYQVNAKLLLKLHRDIEFVRQAKLYVLVDCQLPPTTFAKQVNSIANAGVDLIQIRDKSVDAAKLIEYANAAYDAIDSKSCRIIINDRCDVASFSTTFGVHLGQTDIPIEHARRILPLNSVVGLSTHTPDQYKNAELLGADYIGCGPTFVSQTKSFQAFAGLEYLRFVAEQGDTIPAFAIGGINLENIDQVLSCGIRRVAVASAIWNASSPEKAALAFKSKLN